MRALGVSVIVVVLAVSLGAMAQPDPKQPEKKLTPEQQEMLKESRRHSKESSDLERAGKFKEAIEAAGKMLAIEREVFGNTHEDVAGSLNRIGRMQLRLGDWNAARGAFQEQLEIRVALHGKDDWRTTDARLALDDARLRGRLRKEEQARLATADKLNSDAFALFQQGRPREALAAQRSACDTWKAVLGETHLTYVRGLTNLALLHTEVGEYAAAGALYRQNVEAVRKALGEGHPQYATALSNLSLLYSAVGEFTKAEGVLRRAIDVHRATVGESDTAYANSLNNLARCYVQTGDYPRATRLYAEALAAYGRAVGEDHPLFAGCLSNQADVFRSQKDYDRAEPLYRRALEIKKRTLTPKHPSYATTLNNLAILYSQTGDYARAEPLLREALDVFRASYGGTHDHSLTALSGLALLHLDKGEYNKAEPALQEVARGFADHYGTHHLRYAIALSNQVCLEISRGRPAAAETIAQEALAIARAHLLAMADGQTEQQQLTNLTIIDYLVGGYLSASADRSPSAAAGYAAVLGWKGQVFVRQRRQRELARAAGDDPAVTKVTSDLLAVTRRLATLSGQTPAPGKSGEWKKQVAALAEKRETLETDLTRLSASFRKHKEREALTPEQLRKLLPAKTALVDFYVYTHTTPNPKAKGKRVSEARLVAFIVRPDTDVVRVEIGAFQPLAKAIEEWREKWLKRPHPIMGDDDPAVVLRDKLWMPVAKHLKGVETVLISPDRELSKLPFGALPGSKDTTYLIEELAIAVVPVPQFLPDLLEPMPKVDPSLLVVGDVNYGADPGKPRKPDAGAVATNATRSAVRGERGATWNALPATRDEAVAIKNSFQRTFQKGKVEDLHEAGATEDELRRLMGAHRWVHLATHGYFAPPSVKSLGANDRSGFDADRTAATGHLPGLLSGIVLAGANKPIDPLSDSDDGILTASEVATLDLRGCELVVLSACETGLGPTAGGEGVLGLQRAFQVAGARTVVATLWSVDDEATRKLMVRTYENWLKGKQTKLDGLIEAQRWMLKEGTSEGVFRGLVKVTQKPKEGVPVRTPPLYWAAFVLSGDWR